MAKAKTPAYTVTDFRRDVEGTEQQLASLRERIEEAERAYRRGISTGADTTPLRLQRDALLKERTDLEDYLGMAREELEKAEAEEARARHAAEEERVTKLAQAVESEAGLLVRDLQAALAAPVERLAALVADYDVLRDEWRRLGRGEFGGAHHVLRSVEDRRCVRELLPDLLAALARAAGGGRR